MKTQTEVVPVKRIILDRVEGPTESCGERIASDFRHTDLLLQGMAHTAPEQGRGYDKVDFKIEWEDGETYEGRYDLNKFGEDDDLGQSLVRHVRNHLSFIAHKPDCESSYFKSEEDAEKNAQEALEFMEKYLPVKTARQEFWCCREAR